MGVLMSGSARALERRLGGGSSLEHDGGNFKRHEARRRNEVVSESIRASLDRFRCILGIILTESEAVKSESIDFYGKLFPSI